MDLCDPYCSINLYKFIYSKKIWTTIKIIRNEIRSKYSRTHIFVNRSIDSVDTKGSAISRCFFLTQGRRWASFFPQIVYSAREDLPATILSAGPCHDRPLTTLIWRPRCSCNTPAIIFPVARIYQIVKIA